MRTLKLVLLVVAGTFAATGTPAVGMAADFDFRGARMGMAIEDFKALPPLKSVGAPRCTPGRELDRVVGRAPTPESQAGLVVCSRDGDAPFPTDDFVKSTMTAVSYDFAPDDQQVLRLFKIEMRITSDKFREALDAMTQKLGRPSLSNSMPVQNGFGAKFTNEMRIWQSDSSSAVLSSLCGTVDYGCITYLSNSLNKGYEERLKAIKGNAADRF